MASISLSCDAIQTERGAPTLDRWRPWLFYLTTVAPQQEHQADPKVRRSSSLVIHSATSQILKSAHGGVRSFYGFSHPSQTVKPTRESNCELPEDLWWKHQPLKSAHHSFFPSHHIISTHSVEAEDSGATLTSSGSCSPRPVTSGTQLRTSNSNQASHRFRTWWT